VAISPVRVGIIGMGSMARSHLRNMLPREDTVVIASCEPSSAELELTATEFSRIGLPTPPNEPDFARFLERFAPELDVVFIITPHVFHAAQTTACLEAGADVLLEKPMVMNAAEAEALIGSRDRTGRLLVVAFPGSLSPQVRAAARMIASGEVGALLNVNAMVWQDWALQTTGTWRQDPALSGGGFLFDTGAHMLNTVTDIAGQEIAQVAAWLEDDDRPVDIRGVIIARLASGALVTMNGCGRAIPGYGSDVRIFCERATLRTGIWGERLEMQKFGSRRLSPVRSVPSRTVWEQFLAVRSGSEANPSPPEVGMKMARLWDAIRESSAQGGAVVRLGEAS
jgi:predicted dehydrogenase